MGPIANARMTAAAFFGMPYGIAFAGAQGCIQAVQSGTCVLPARNSLFVSGTCLTPYLRYAGNSEGAATLTADLVDLGYVRAVTWIVLNLVDRDQSDVVVEVRLSMHILHWAQPTTCAACKSAFLDVLSFPELFSAVSRKGADLPVLQVSVAMMAKGYVSQMTLITKEVLQQGRADAGASISGEMLKNGNLDFVKIWNESRKADEGEDEEDPKSVTDQVKDAVGSVVGNAQGMPFADGCN